MSDSTNKSFYPPTSIGKAKRILGVLQPKTIEEVQSFVEWANKENKSLYPISGGRNWGYGSKSPVEGNS